MHQMLRASTCGLLLLALGGATAQAPQITVECTGPHALCTATSDCTVANGVSSCPCWKVDEPYIVVTGLIQDPAVLSATNAACTTTNPCAVNQAPVCQSIANGTYTVNGTVSPWVSTFSYRNWCPGWHPVACGAAPWANCIGSPCTAPSTPVDPNRPLLCHCALQNSAFIGTKGTCATNAGQVMSSLPSTAWDFALDDFTFPMPGYGYVKSACQTLAQATSGVCPLLQSVVAGTITSAERAQLASAIQSSTTPVQCTVATAAGSATVWGVYVASQQPQTFASAGAPGVTITNWGTTVPLVATVVTYPPAALNNKQVDNRRVDPWNIDCDPGFLVFVDRMTPTGTPINNPNPLTFQVSPVADLNTVWVADAVMTQGVSLTANGGQWVQDGQSPVVVQSPKGVFFLGCLEGGSSPLGLLGLLGLLAIPICCCCLPLLLWWCWRRRQVTCFCEPPMPPCCGMQHQVMQPQMMGAEFPPMYSMYPAIDVPYY